MKRRYIYAVLVGVPGLMLSIIATFMCAGMTVGLLWMLVLGGSKWPDGMLPVLGVLLAVFFVSVVGAAAWAGYQLGLRREGDAALNWLHVGISAGITTLLVSAFVMMVVWLM